MRKNAIFLVVALTLSACASGEPRLLNVGARADSPDEFSVLPGKPLQRPASFAALPEPTPGGSNLTDATPRSDAIATLGGRPSSVAGGVSASDAGLVTYASRYGVPADIREQLHAADVARRRGAGVLFFQRLFGGNRYFATYRGFSLDQYKELDRMRRSGIGTPSAPPQ